MKPWLSKSFKLLSVLVTVMLILVMLYYVCIQCGKGNLLWHLDYNYTYSQTIQGPEYATTPGFKATDIVDGLRIYKERRKGYGWYGLRELLEKELVFETNDKDYIVEFLRAAHQWMMVGDWEDKVMDTEEASKGCGQGHWKEQEFDRFYVVMFDNTFMRAGYFMVVLCNSQDREYINILMPDKSGFGPISYYNDSLIPILRKIHL